MPEHGRAALSAADTVADLPDALAFLGRLIPTPCAFDRDGFFVDVFVDDRLEFFIAGVLRILQYSAWRKSLTQSGFSCFAFAIRHHPFHF